MYFLKKILIIAAVAGAMYMVLGYHYIVIDKSVKMLKKSELTLKYTFFSTKGRSLDSIFSNQELWDDGIGELLLEEGKISEEELTKWEKKIDGEESESY
jgi:hypothetical protein